MCPGISLSTLSHDIRLLDILKFKDICNRVSITIEYDPGYTDVNVIDNKLVQRTNENEYSREHPYSQRQIYHPSIHQTTDLVGETDMISSFLEAQKITDVTWLQWTRNVDHRHDISVMPYKCKAYKGDTCVPAHRHVPRYIFTRYPDPKTGLEM